MISWKIICLNLPLPHSIFSIWVFDVSILIKKLELHTLYNKIWILAAAWEGRRRESSRRGGDGGEEEESVSGDDGWGKGGWWFFFNSETETGDTRVGGWSCAEAGQKNTAGYAGHHMTVGEIGVGLISVNNNKWRILGPEWSTYEVGTPPPHNSEKLHGLVASINNKIIFESF